MSVADVELSLAFMQPLTHPPILLRELMGGRTLRFCHLVLGASTVIEIDAVNKGLSLIESNLCEFDPATAQSRILEAFHYNKKSPQQLALRY